MAQDRVIDLMRADKNDAEAEKKAAAAFYLKRLDDVASYNLSSLHFQGLLCENLGLSSGVHLPVNHRTDRSGINFSLP